MIADNIAIDEQAVPRTKKILYCAVEFEASEENKIMYESL